MATYFKQTANSPAHPIYSGYPTIEEEIQNNSNLKIAWMVARLKHAKDSEEDIAVYCYTQQNPPFYQLLNQTLREWNKKETKDIFPYKNYVNLLAKQVQKVGQKRIYRGISSPEFYASAQNFQLGQIVDSDCFESCSLEREVAKHFCGSEGTLFRIFTKFAIEILDKSEYPGEREYLIPPGAKFRVTKIKKGTKDSPCHEIDLADVEFIITTMLDDMVVDAKADCLTVEKYSNSDFQKWYIQMNYVHNKATGEVLDVDANGGRGTNVILYELHGNSNQEWCISGSTLKCGHKNLVMDVGGGRIVPRAAIIVWTPNGKDNQKFFFKPIELAIS